MKRYNNLAFQIVVLLPISSLLYLLIIIIGSIFIRNQGLDFIIMCIVLSCVFVMIWFVLFFMKDIFIITYYDEEKNPTTDGEGCASIEYAYNEQGEQEEQPFDLQGNKIN